MSLPMSVIILVGAKNVRLSVVMIIVRTNIIKRSCGCGGCRRYMVTIREKNAKDLKSAWEKFIKEQEGKHEKQKH